MTTRAKITALAAAAVAALLSAAPARGREPAATGAITTVRVTTTDLAGSMIEHLAKQYEKEHPDVRIEIRSGALAMIACQELAAGRADLITLCVGDDDIYRTPYQTDDQKPAVMSDTFKPGDLETHLLARWAMAVVVNPANKLDEIAADQVLQFTRWGAGQDGNDPFAGSGLTILRSGVFSTEMTRRILGPESGQRYRLPSRIRHVGARTSISDVIDRVTADANMMVFQTATDQVWSSGAKVLPVRLANGRRVLPTPELVMSGDYPYYTSLMLVTPAKASTAARDFAAVLARPESRSLLREDLITPDTRGPGEAKRIDWPRIDANAVRPTAAPVTAAVLPVEQLSHYFRLADKAVQARYEDNLVAGITRAGQTTLLDRTQLRKALAERALTLHAGGAATTRPIIAADVIVLGRVVSREKVTCLRVEAFHSGTATCIGLLDLPIDSAHPAEFDPPLKDLAAKWWPGVITNLARARKGPIWMLTEDSPAAGQPAPPKARAAMEETLAAAEGIFFARYSYVPAAQREVLMRLLGLSRAAGTMPVAADYIVAVSEGPHVARAVIRRGKDMAELAQHSGDAKELAEWLKKQIAAVAAVPASQEGAAQQQAHAEYLRGKEIQKELYKLHDEALNRRFKANRDTLFPDDQRKIDELERRMAGHFERAIQLNPASEANAYENIIVLNRTQDSRYLSLRGYAEACLAFVDNYPRSAHARMVMERAFWALSGLCLYLEGGKSYETSEYVAMPAGLDHATLAKQYRRQQLSLLAEYMRLFLARPGKRGDSMYSWETMTEGYRRCLDKYAEVAAPAELDEALDEYAGACDAYPGEMPHSDALRLGHLARRGEKQEYVDLLARMQKRWRDPADAHWKDAADDIVKDMTELFRIDPRRNSLYLWLKGRRGPGDLPYAGYQAASQPASGPAATVPARQATKETK
jgi:hypothetical protein